MQERRENLFICCCEEDKRWLTKFQKALAPLSRKEQFQIWDYTSIAATAKWQEEIEKAVASSKVALLLVSIEFLASNFIVDYELPLLSTAQADGLKIAWVAVSPSLYQYTNLAEHQALNDPAQPLDSFASAKLKRELIHICKRIKRIMDEPIVSITRPTEKNIRIVNIQKQADKELTEEEVIAS